MRTHPGGFLKYVVEVNGERVMVDLGANGITVEGMPVAAHLEVVEGTPVCLLNAGGTRHRFAVRRGDARGKFTLWSDAWRFEVEALDERRRAIRDLAGEGAATAGPSPLVAPMPGLVVRVTANVGDRVEVGQALVVMEAMKMENELRSTASGIVAAVRVVVGQAVEKGSVLVELS